MKIRCDFVTNSSTTSYVIICEGKPQYDDFLSAVGAKKGTPAEDLFRLLYDALCDDIKPVDKAYREGTDTVFDMLKKEFSERTAERVQIALRDGKDVWYGSLASESTDVEAFFCMDPFEVETENVYINALPCGW